MRRLICQCLGKVRALEMLLAYGFGKDAIGQLSSELAFLLDKLLWLHDQAVDENDMEHREGGAE